MSVLKLHKIRLKKGDTVVVRSGKYKGQAGKVIAVHPRTNKVTVEGINIVKRHVKPTRQQPQGGITETVKPMQVSKVGILDPQTKKPSRIGYTLKDSSKVRIYKSSGKEIKS